MSTDKPSIAIVACSKTKMAVTRALARDLYCSRLFNLSRRYAERYCDDWRILSAMHFVVSPDQEIETYERSLSFFKREGLETWADHCRSRLHATWPHGSARFILLGSAAYGKALEGLANVERPLKGMGIGQQIAWLSRALAQGQPVAGA